MAYKLEQRTVLQSTPHSSPFGKGGWRGIFSIKSPLAPLFQSGGQKAASSGGQTIIETVLVLTLLFIVLFVIVEFSRAWYLKNSLNNAARVAARVAAVTSGITITNGTATTATKPIDCTAPTDNDIVFCAAFDSPGVPDGTEATLSVDLSHPGDTHPTDLNAGDTVTVGVSSIFNTIVPVLLNGIVPASMNINSSATMRFELDVVE